MIPIVVFLIIKCIDREKVIGDTHISTKNIDSNQNRKIKNQIRTKMLYLYYWKQCSLSFSRGKPPIEKCSDYK
jgi:hypothetical protein